MSVGCFLIHFSNFRLAIAQQKLEKMEVAFIVIGILGVKLLLSIPAHYSHNMPIFKYIESEHFDMIVSIITVLVFFVPVITSLLFNYPKRHEIKEEEE